MAHPSRDLSDRTSQGPSSRDVIGDRVPTQTSRLMESFLKYHYLTLATVMVSPFMSPVIVTCLPAKGTTFA
jgi:hypothetical protein